MQKTDFTYEVLIHDDASTDGTEQIIREYEQLYPQLIKPLYEQENQWNKGRRGSAIFNIPRASGKYIAFCEGDDYWIDPYKLQKQVDFLETNPDYGLVYGNTMILTPYGKLYPRPPRVIDSFDDILRFNGIGTATTCFRKDVYLKFRSETDDVSKSWMMADYPFYLWLYLHSKIHSIDDYFAVYLKHEGSSTYFKNYENGETFLLAVVRIKTYYYSFYKGKSPLRIFLRYEYTSLFNISLQHSKFLKSLRYFGYFPIDNLRFLGNLTKMRLFKTQKLD